MQLAPYSSNCTAELLASLLTDFCAPPAAAPTRDLLAAKFKEIATFELRPGILVFPTVGAEGRLGSVIIEKPGYLEGQNVRCETTIRGEQVNLLMDELVPFEWRGNPSKYLDSDSFIAGGASLTLGVRMRPSFTDKAYGYRRPIPLIMR
jgi:hypothetical protein